jgi:eukaryotic translation initiation factor 2C
MSGNQKGNKKVCHHCRDPGNITANCPQGKGKGKATTGLPDRTGPPNQTRPTPPTEADFISFGIRRTEGQKYLTTDDLKFEHGLRTDYGTTNERGLEIIANYVKIEQKPEWVYVYKLHFVRLREPPAQDKVLKNKAEKCAVFEALKQRPGYASLRDRKDYATDYDVIWSTKPLFPDKTTGDNATPAEAVVSQFNPPVVHPFTGQSFQCYSVKITWEKTIDAQANVRSFQGGPDGDTDDFTRGINAFMTQHARENAAARGYQSTAANRFFLTEDPHQHQLDPDRPDRQQQQGRQQQQRKKQQKALVALRGFTLSARPGNDDWYLNLHVGASPFLLSGKVDELIDLLSNMELAPRDVFNCFKNREVLITNPGGAPIRRIITEIGNVHLQDHKTWKDFNTALSPQHRTLTNLPVNVGPRAPAPNPEVYEAGDMTVQGFHPFRGLLTPAQTTRMLAFACKLPVYNKRHIWGAGFHMFGISTPTGQSRIADYGLAVENALLKIPARLLSPPGLLYKQLKSSDNRDRQVESKEADWNLANLRFFRPATNLTRVVVMDLGFHGQNLGGVAAGLQRELQVLGMERVVVDGTLDLRIPCNPVPTDDDLQNNFRKIRGPVSAVFVILPNFNYDLYSRIKRVADLRLGCHVVCATARKMDGFRIGWRESGHYANIGMKFNLKGKGTNHAVDPSHLQSIIHTRPPTSAPAPAPAACRTIIIGADVAHPTGTTRPGCPSIAAVVGSVDDNYLHYPGSMRLQISKQEFIADLRDMVKERLIDWAAKHQNTLPANMLMYRDGVSESQYQAVREFEIPQLQDAFNDAYELLNKGSSAKSNPPQFKLTSVVVGKRHNTRFFTDETTLDSTFLTDLSAKEADNNVYEALQREEEQVFQRKAAARGKEVWTRVNHNIKPGFVVDQVITHPYREDFFLQSHKPLQGTGRSAHYFVMTNQMKLDSDELQKVTHALCYIYARATKGVSYCAPAYYADRLCDRGRAWLREFLMGRNFIRQHKDEDFLNFKQRALEEIDKNDGNTPTYWRPQPSTETKYGEKRKNPWHKDLDDIMFYL